MLLSIIILAVGVIFLYAAGLPLTYFLLKITKSKNDSQKLWYFSMFTGFAVISIILKSLVAFNLPIKYTAWPLAAIILVSCIFFIYKKHADIPKPSKMFIFGFIAVMILQSLGYLIIGAAQYQGYYGWDNLFYVTQTQFLIDHPLSSILDVFPNSPWMAYAIQSPYHRISRAMLQGFIAVICGVNAEYTIGFINILASLLTFCALKYAAALLNMNKYTKIAAAFFGAMVSGLAYLSLEGFCAAALTVPFFIMFCALFCSVMEKPAIGNSLLCAMLLACVTTLYTQSTLVFIAITAVIFIYFIVTERAHIKTVYIPVLIFAGVLLINCQYIKSIYINELTGFGTGSFHGLDEIYAFAQSGTGYAYAYIGITTKSILNFVAIFVALGGLLGLIIRLFEKGNPLLFAFIALVLSPIMFMYSDQVYLYNYFRMILMTSPIIILGLWLFFEKILTVIRESGLKTLIFRVPLKRLYIGAVCFAMIVVSGLSAFCTSVLLIRAKNYQNAHMASLVLQNELFENEHENILLITQKNLWSWWLMYYARNNNVWLCHESIDDYYVQTDRTDYSYLNYAAMPDPENVLIVHDPTYYSAVYPENASERTDAFLVNNSTSCVVGEDSGNGAGFTLTVYSKDNTTGIFAATVGSETDSSFILSINGENYTVKSGDILTFPFAISKGFTDLAISASGDNPTLEFSLTNYTVTLD